MTINLSKRVLAILGYVGVLVVGLVIGAVVLGGGGGDTKTETVTTTVAEMEGDEEQINESAAEEEAEDDPELSGDCEDLRDEGKEGRCEEEGVEFVIVNKAGVLKLKTLEAKLLAIRKGTSYTSFGEAETASGTYVTFELEVTNNGSVPQEFDSYQEQVIFVANGNNYTQDFDVQNGPIEDSFAWQAEEIQPEGSLVGTVTFDLPDKAVSSISTGGNLDIGNFGEELGEESKEVGVIRTYR